MAATENSKLLLLWHTCEYLHAKFVYLWPAVSQIKPNLRTYHMIPVIAYIIFVKMAATEKLKIVITLVYM